MVTRRQAQELAPADVEPGVETIGAVPAEPVDGELYQSVRKHGRTTQHTVGVVMDVSADLWVRVGPPQQAWFEVQLAVVGAGGPSPSPEGGGRIPWAAMDADAPRQPPSAAALQRAKRAARELVSAVEGVRGVGVGDGTIRTYVCNADVTASLPADVDGVAVEAVVVGDVTAY